MKEISNKIDLADHIVVISHVNPEAGAICSASAMYTYLLQKHKKVSWYCKTKDLPAKLSFIPWFEKIRNSFPSSADLAISFDGSKTESLGIEPECELVSIDSHLCTVSTSEIVYDFFKANAVKINSKMATSLYAGILADTDGFMDEKVNVKTYAIIQELVECGAEYKASNHFIMRTLSLGALRLKALMLGRMSLVLDARVALFCVSDEDMKSTGAVSEDCDLALEESLYLPYTEVAILLKQNSDLSVEVSIHSKGGVDASKIALGFDGGGSFKKAGFSTDRAVTLQGIKQEVLNLVKKEM